MVDKGYAYVVAALPVTLFALCVMMAQNEPTTPVVQNDVELLPRRLGADEADSFMYGMWSAMRDCQDQNAPVSVHGMIEKRTFIETANDDMYSWFVGLTHDTEDQTSDEILDQVGGMNEHANADNILTVIKSYFIVIISLCEGDNMKGARSFDWQCGSLCDTLRSEPFPVTDLMALEAFQAGETNGFGHRNVMHVIAANIKSEGWFDNEYVTYLQSQSGQKDVSASDYTGAAGNGDYLEGETRRTGLQVRNATCHRFFAVRPTMAESAGSVLQNLMTWMVPLAVLNVSVPCAECMIHMGYASTFKSISRNDVLGGFQRSVYDYFCQSAISSASRGFHDLKFELRIIGFSQGSALATIWALQTHARWHSISRHNADGPVSWVYLFASPRVGNHYFMEKYNDRLGWATLRVMFWMDGVPHFPSITSGFRHVGYRSIVFSQANLHYKQCTFFSDDWVCSEMHTPYVAADKQHSEEESDVGGRAHFFNSESVISNLFFMDGCGIVNKHKFWVGPLAKSFSMASARSFLHSQMSISCDDNRRNNDVRWDAVFSPAWRDEAEHESNSLMFAYLKLSTALYTHSFCHAEPLICKPFHPFFPFTFKAENLFDPLITEAAYSEADGAEERAVWWSDSGSGCWEFPCQGANGYMGKNGWVHASGTGYGSSGGGGGEGSGYSSF